jgi:hypothetical protein
MRAPTLRRAAAGVAALIFLGLPTTAAAANEEFFGVNGQAVFSRPDVDSHLAAMQAGGLQLLRRDASWIGVEPEPPDSSGNHDYHWDAMDSEVEALARHKLRYYPTIDYSTAWSGQVESDPMSAPARVEDYVAYAAALARRYGANGDFWRAHPELSPLPVTRWEVWNEPNSKHFWHPNERAPEEYADLYLRTRAALRQVDPAARVVVGGLALANVDVIPEGEFVERMYRHRPELAGNVDAFGFHPYSATLDGVYLKLRELRATLARLGAADVPLDITELGWTTTKTSDADRAAALSRLAEDLPRSDCRIESLIPHTWVTAEQDPGNPEDWFGIYNHDATPKPSGAAYLAAVGRMRGAAGQPLRICGDPPARGPSLRLRVTGSRTKPSRLVAVASCVGGCELSFDVLAVKASGGERRQVRVTRRSLRFSSRRRRISLRAPRWRPGRRFARIHVTATGRSGAFTRRVHSVRIPRPARG